MKKSLTFIVTLLVGLAIALPAMAQVYPYTNPTYIPNAVGTTTLAASAVPVTFTNAGSNTIAIQVTGTCTALAATAQGSVDGTNYVTVNMFPITTSTITAAASISATGAWRINSAGFKKARLNVTALSGTTCYVTMVGSPAAFTGTY